ncbi:MAG: hypothetical protein EPO21_01910 [Chloroflexota bacterium]|nr:MAG: hypothetical protein EPO21_01910 [Chloroflexota bacterium]
MQPRTIGTRMLKAVSTQTAMANQQATRSRVTHIAALLRLLRSRELALVLLGVILVGAVSGTLVPQKALVSPADFQNWQTEHARWAELANGLGLTRVYNSWWFLTLLGLLFLSLLVCTVSNCRRTWRIDRHRHREECDVPRSVRRDGGHLTIQMSDTQQPQPTSDAHPLVHAPFQRASVVLRQVGYRVRPVASGSALFAGKRRYGIWGSAIFHLGLMIVLLGGAYSGGGKMAGYFELAEGQTFTEQRGGYLQIDEGPLFREQHASFRLRLDQLHTRYWDNGTLREMSSAVTVQAPSGETRTALLGPGRPLSFLGASIYQANQHGFAVLLSLKDAAGNTISSGFVNFATPSEPTHPATNRFPLPGVSLQAEADFYPAPQAEALDVENWSQARPDESWLYLFLRDEQERLVFQGPLALGDSITFNGYALSFKQVSRWAGFPVVRDPGLPIIFTGFGLCILGAAIIYLWVPRRIWVWVERTAEGNRALCIGGRADRYQASMDEEVAELATRMILLHDSSFVIGQTESVA